MLTNVKEGMAESAKIGGMTTVNDKANFTFGAFTTSTFNIAGLLKFYGVVEGDATQPLQTLYKDLNFAGGSFTAPGINCTFGKVSAAEFDARPLKVSFTQMMDAAQQMSAAKGGNPPPEAVSTYVTFLLDVFSAYKSTPMTLDGLNCKGADGDKTAEVSLGTVSIDGYQPGTYPAITANDLKVDAGAQATSMLPRSSSRRQTCRVRSRRSMRPRPNSTPSGSRTTIATSFRPGAACR